MTESRLPSKLRQAELTDAALRIIATRGISELTTRALAEEVGLTTGAIFRHFASLDALLDAVVARVEAVLDGTFPSPALEPLERLDRFVDARSEAVASQMGILRLVLSEQFHLALPSGSSKRLTACVQKTRAFLKTCVEDGQRSGEFRSDIDPDALVAVVMGTLQMLALSHEDARVGSTRARRLRRALLLLLRAPVRSTKRKK